MFGAHERWHFGLDRSAGSIDSQQCICCCDGDFSQPVRTGVGLVASSWLLSANRLVGTSALLPGKERIMNQHTLKNCIATLSKLRDVYKSQLDACVLVELDEIVVKLQELYDAGEGKKELGILSIQGLQLINHIVILVSNITDLMK